MISSFRKQFSQPTPANLRHFRYWPTWILLGLFFLFSKLPISWLDSAAVKLAAFLSNYNKKRFRIVKTNLGLCFPDKSENAIEEMVVRHFELLVKGLLHYGILWWASEKKLRKMINVEGFDQVKACQDAGKNVIVLLSHCTGLEFAVLAISSQFDASGPYKPFENPVLDWLIQRSRERFGDQSFTREDGLRPIIKSARQGKVIIYLADEDLGAEVSTFAPFMGIQKATVPVLGRLAKACNACVLPAFSCYDENSHQYKVTLFPPAEDFPANEVNEDSRLMNQMIEKTIHSCPVQYFWTLKLFKTRPEGEAKVYS
jgi:lipid A biosynthesis (KDO)2-(lauroyl)-lipid IVA acyltransferase